MTKHSNTTVIVGMSGGVDSAVAALRLLDAGYSVQGLHMTNWDADDDYCEAAQDYQDARLVCEDLGIPLHHVNFSKEYREKVFADFLDEYRKGRTPNPDVACNRTIKFGDCFNYALRLGADYVATGHYARIKTVDGRTCLLQALDDTKDQSYFLHAINGAVLPQVMFPLGDLQKSEVRRIANDRGLVNHARKDSTGICFIGERPFREFLQNYIAISPGNIRTPEGQLIAQHEGLAYYTLGQRQGLGVGGVQGYPDEPWFVADKDLDKNELVVVQGHDHPLLYSRTLRSEPVYWLQGQSPGKVFRCSAKTRYRQQEVACEVRIEADGSAQVSFDAPVWAVTPGQYVVFYYDSECLGGAVIESRSLDWKPLEIEVA